MDDGTIYGIGNAAAALGITRKALRFLITSQSDKLGIARVGAPALSRRCKHAPTSP